MTKNLKDILAKANELASAKGIDKTTDEDFIARVEAACLMHHVNWACSLDNASLLAKMKRFYPQFLCRIESKENVRQALPLIKALRRFIYGFISIKIPVGPDNWKDTLTKYESELPVHDENPFVGMSEEELKSMNLKDLSNEDLYKWCEATYKWPVKELKHRSSNSRLMKVAYLRALTVKELEHIRDVEDEHFLRRQFKELNEDIIPDLLTIKITSTLPVATLNALQTIYTLRSGLAFDSHDFNEPTYANLQCHRLMQISKALKIKYSKSRSIDEKIEILQLINDIEQILSCTFSDFALEKADWLLNRYLGKLTEFQRLRLDWIPSIDAENYDSLVVDLLPKAQTAYDIITLSLGIDFCKEETLKAIIDKFKEIFAKALSEKNVDVLSLLLSSASTWNIHPNLRPLFRELESQVSALPLPHPVNRVNSIAAEIYSRIDAIANKYNTIPA